MQIYINCYAMECCGSCSKKFVGLPQRRSSCSSFLHGGGKGSFYKPRFNVHESESILQVSFNNKFRAIFFLGSHIPICLVSCCSEECRLKDIDTVRVMLKLICLAPGTQLCNFKFVVEYIIYYLQHFR